jgi:hypothetical protein
MQNPSILAIQRDSKNDSIFGARREIQRRRRHAPICMGATELQSNWPEMRKTLGKPGIYQRRGQEPNFLMFSLWFIRVRKAPENGLLNVVRLSVGARNPGRGTIKK